MIIGMHNDRDERLMGAVVILEQREREVEQQVAIDEEGAFAGGRQPRKAPCGPERLGFDAQLERKTERARLLPERTSELIARLAGEHGDMGDALASKHPELMKDDRHASDRRQRLWSPVAAHCRRAGGKASCDDD